MRCGPGWTLVLLLVLLVSGCASTAARPGSSRANAGDPTQWAGVWHRPAHATASAQWLVLDADGSASLLGADGLWAIAWRGEAGALTLTTQTQDNPASRELRLWVMKKPGATLKLASAHDEPLHRLAGEWRRASGELRHVTGSITVSERITLPPDAVLRVAVQEARRVGGPPQTVAVRDIVLGTTAFPVRYHLHVPAELLDAAQPYVLRARVTAAGVARYASQSLYEVLTLGAPTNADITLDPVETPVRLRAPPAAPLAEQVVALEKAFGEAARARGTKSAFLEFLAEDGIVLEPGPVFGRAAWESRPDSPGLLEWLPDRAQGSASADLGVATGPWLFTAPGGTGRVAGVYLTVWRKSEAGWRVVFDGGFGAPAAADARLPAVTPTLDIGDCERGAAGDPAELQLLDRALSASAGKTTAALVAARAGHNLLWLQPPNAAGASAAAATQAVAAQPATLQFRPMGGFAAAAGDLGFTYGLIEPSEGAAANAAYGHVWCRQRGDWKLLVVLRRPLE